VGVWGEGTKAMITYVSTRKDYYCTISYIHSENFGIKFDVQDINVLHGSE